MSYQIILRNRAVDEMNDAYQWYEKAVEGLGAEFLSCIKNYLDKIVVQPHQFKTTYRNFKEVYIKQFPFVIVYLVDEKKKQIVIFSIFHCSQNPNKKFKRS
jgi:mRNA-degrading endonuclease RelE of RelBE toxin-antitoxin system